MRRRLLESWSLILYHFLSQYIGGIILFASGYWISFLVYGYPTVTLEKLLIMGGIAATVSFSYTVYTIVKK